MPTKDMTGRSKSVVSSAMKNAKTKEEFVKALRAKGMDAVFRTNDDETILKFLGNNQL